MSTPARGRAVATRLAAVAAGAALAGSGLAGCSDSGANQRATVAAPTSAADGAPDPASSSAPAAGRSERVHVTTQMRIPASAASRSFVEFVEAHAESVRAGGVTPALRRLSTPSQLETQTQAIRLAANHGLTVQADPRVAVVSGSSSAGVARLGVCLWLPSTEFVDAVTGNAPSAAIPRRWLPATVVVKRTDVTWVVDTVVSLDAPLVDDCRGLS